MILEHELGVLGAPSVKSKSIFTNAQLEQFTTVWDGEYARLKRVAQGTIAQGQTPREFQKSFNSLIATFTDNIEYLNQKALGGIPDYQLLRLSDEYQWIQGVKKVVDYLVVSVFVDWLDVRSQQAIKDVDVATMMFILEISQSMSMNLDRLIDRLELSPNAKPLPGIYLHWREKKSLHTSLEELSEKIIQYACDAVGKITTYAQWERNKGPVGDLQRYWKDKYVPNLNKAIGQGIAKLPLKVFWNEAEASQGNVKPLNDYREQVRKVIQSGTISDDFYLTLNEYFNSYWFAVRTFSMMVEDQIFSDVVSLTNKNWQRYVNKEVLYPAIALYEEIVQAIANYSRTEAGQKNDFAMPVYWKVLREGIDNLELLILCMQDYPSIAQSTKLGCSDMKPIKLASWGSDWSKAGERGLGWQRIERLRQEVKNLEESFNKQKELALQREDMSRKVASVVRDLGDIKTYDDWATTRLAKSWGSILQNVGVHSLQDFVSKAPDFEQKVRAALVAMQKRVIASLWDTAVRMVLKKKSIEIAEFKKTINEKDWKEAALAINQLILLYFEPASVNMNNYWNHLRGTIDDTDIKELEVLFNDERKKMSVELKGLFDLLKAKMLASQDITDTDLQDDFRETDDAIKRFFKEKQGDEDVRLQIVAGRLAILKHVANLSNQKAQVEQAKKDKTQNDEEKRFPGITKLKQDIDDILTKFVSSVPTVIDKSNSSSIARNGRMASEEIVVKLLEYKPAHAEILGEQEKFKQLPDALLDIIIRIIVDKLQPLFKPELNISAKRQLQTITHPDSVVPLALNQKGADPSSSEHDDIKKIFNQVFSLLNDKLSSQSV